MSPLPSRVSSMKWFHSLGVLSGVAIVILGTLAWKSSGQPKPAEPTLLDIHRILKAKQFVDLTHAFAPGIPHWPGFPDEKRKTIYWYEKRSNVMGTGFFSELYTHVGQWGTHVDPPAHFIKGLRTVDQIDPKEMVLPLVIIDV